MTADDLKKLQDLTMQPPMFYPELCEMLQQKEWECKFHSYSEVRNPARGFRRQREKIENQVFIHETLPVLLAKEISKSASHSGGNASQSIPFV